MNNETTGAGGLETPTPTALEQAGGTVPDDYVLAFDAPDFETGEIVCATLIAEGLHAVMANPELGPGDNAIPALGQTWTHSVYVAPADLEAALRILATPPPSEEELAAEQAADPTTLEQAEQIARDA